MAYSNNLRLKEARDLRARMEYDGLSSNDAVVLQEIAACASRATQPPTGGRAQRIVDTSFPSEETLAVSTLLSARTVARSIKRLQETSVPYITVVSVPGRQVNRYVLNRVLFVGEYKAPTSTPTAAAPQTTPAAKPAYVKPYQFTPNRPAAPAAKPTPFNYS